MIIRLVTYFFILIFLETKGFAQPDTIRYHLGTLTGLSTQNYLPHWITANRFGILDDQNYAVSLIRGGVTTTYKVSKQWSFDANLDVIAKFPYVQGPEQKSNIFLQQGYLKAKFNIFELTGGWVERTLGTHAEGISTGSLALSGNARPFPQILIAVPNYSPIPFTEEFVEFKGTYSHAWLEKDRYIQNAFLHEKSLYLKFGGKYKVNFAAGLIHHVIWGGEHQSIGKLPSGLKDYWQVIRAQAAEGVDLTNPALLGEAANALGDNLGFYDFSLDVKLKNAAIQIYHQTPFEDWTGSRLFRNKDRLLGIYLKNNKNGKWLESVVYEFLYTKYQSGPSRPGGAEDVPGAKDKYGYDFGGRDNYYNNAIYKTGWVYQGRIIGTSLFFTRERTKLYVPDFVEPDKGGFNFNITNNRVVAHHVGLQGHLSESVHYKLFSTFTKNYGTYGGINGGITEWGSIENPELEYTFKPPKNQNYFLLEIESHPFSKSWSLLTAIAWDTGSLTRNFGALVGLKREGVIRIKTDK